MTEQYLPHNRRARADCTHQISAYTMRYTQLYDSILKLAQSHTGNRYVSQDQSKVEKIQKGKVCHRKCQYEGPFQNYQRV